MVAFAEMLDLPSNTFDKHYTKGDLGTIRLLYYPGLENLSNRQRTSDWEKNTSEEAQTVDSGISAHTDFECFTLMHQDKEGLQFMLPSNSAESKHEVKWVDAPVRAGEFVVIVGACYLPTPIQFHVVNELFFVTVAIDRVTEN